MATEHKMVLRTEWARPPLSGQVNYGSCVCGGWNVRLDTREPTPATTMSRLYREHVWNAEVKERQQ